MAMLLICMNLWRSHRAVVSLVGERAKLIGAHLQLTEVGVSKAAIVGVRTEIAKHLSDLIPANQYRKSTESFLVCSIWQETNQGHQVY